MVTVGGGNHMCRRTLKDIQLPLIAEWFLRYL